MFNFFYQPPYLKLSAHRLLLLMTLLLTSLAVNSASRPKVKDISSLISNEVFSSYQNVADFIEHSPKVTILVPADDEDKALYGDKVMKSLTGADCDRDGKMDDNQTCNAVYLKLWLKYAR